MAAETTMTIARISVRVTAAPDLFLLRSVIAARLAGHAAAAGPEAQVAEHLAAAVADRLRGEGRCH